MEKAFEDIFVDTIVLLSDGAPMKRGKGTREDPSSGLIRDILRWVKDANAGRRVKIDALGFVGQGEWPAGSKYARQPPATPAQLKQFETFLQDLAQASGGRFRAVD